MPRHPLKTVAYSLGLLVIGLAVGEGLTRIGLYVAIRDALPTSEMRRFVDEDKIVFDPALGWRPAAARAVKPGSFAHAVGDVLARRTAEDKLIVALGDSQTMGAGLHPTEAFPSVAERALRERGVRALSVNLAVAGYRSSQILQTIEAQVLDYAPAVIVVDARVGDSARLARDYDARFAALRRALFYSRLYRVLRLGVAWSTNASLGPVGVVDLPEDAQGQEGNHAEIAALCAAARVPLVFVDYPFVANPAKSLAPAERLPPGATVVPATAALLASGMPAKALFLDNNHMTAAGNRLVGTALADTLEPLLR